MNFPAIEMYVSDRGFIFRNTQECRVFARERNTKVVRSNELESRVVPVRDETTGRAGGGG